MGAASLFWRYHTPTLSIPNRQHIRDRFLKCLISLDNFLDSNFVKWHDWKHYWCVGMLSKRYASDLTDEQWQLTRSMIPPAKFGGRPRSTDERRVLDGILYLVRTGCQWRQLPHDFPPWQTVYRYFVAWNRRGVVRKIQRALYELIRYAEQRSEAPSALVIDSQSVKTGKAGGDRGFDGGKRVKGRKRHVVTDTLGYMIDVSVTPANVHDKTGAKLVLAKAARWLKPLPKTVFADGGYSGKPFADWVSGKFAGATVQIGVNLAQAAKRFIPSAKRWVIERTFAWFGDYRRLDKDHERLKKRSVGMIRWAMIAFMLRRLMP